MPGSCCEDSVTNTTSSNAPTSDARNDSAVMTKYKKDRQNH